MKKDIKISIVENVQILATKEWDKDFEFCGLNIENFKCLYIP